MEGREKTQEGSKIWEEEEEMAIRRKTAIAA